MLLGYNKSSSALSPQRILSGNLFTVVNALGIQMIWILKINKSEGINILSKNKINCKQAK